MHIVGDTHGITEKLIKQIDRCPTDMEDIVLVGDVGFGFAPTHYITRIFSFFPDKKFFIIQGNHDNADVMSDGENWEVLTTEKTWTTKKIGGEDVLLIAGAYSIDKALRTPGKTWWANEQGSERKFDDLIEALPELKFDIILSHDAPLSQYQLFNSQVKISLTNLKLGLLFEQVSSLNRPITWGHGHLHRNYIEQYGNVMFVGVSDDSCITLF